MTNKMVGALVAMVVAFLTAGCTRPAQYDVMEKLAAQQAKGTVVGYGECSQFQTCSYIVCTEKEWRLMVVRVNGRNSNNITVGDPESIMMFAGLPEAYPISCARPAPSPTPSPSPEMAR
jgi:hypothetical protein